MLRALEGRARVPRVLAVCEDDGVHRRAVLRDGGGRSGTSSRARCPPASTSPAERRATARRADRRARRDPRRRLARGRAGGLRQARRLPRAPAAPLPRALGAQQDARDPGGRDRRRLAGDQPARPRRRRRSSTATTASATSCSRPSRRRAIAAVLDWEMSTIGDPLADLGYFCTLYVERDDPSLGKFELSGVTREEGWPTRAELVARYEERSGSLDDRHPLVPDARAVEVDRLHGGQLPARVVGA